jgi:hypothetical protein
MEFHDMYEELISCEHRINDTCTCELFLRRVYGLSPSLDTGHGVRPERINGMYVHQCEPTKLDLRGDDGFEDERI